MLNLRIEHQSIQRPVKLKKKKNIVNHIYLILFLKAYTFIKEIIIKICGWDNVSEMGF